jgi:DNA-directed RNA polymerase alpha subunit
MIRAIHARGILEALARTAEAGPVFDVIYRCAKELDEIVRAETTESFRERSIEDLEISIRLGNALDARGIKTVRQLEAMTAEELMKSKDFFGKKMLRETREILASLGMKLKGDP